MSKGLLNLTRSGDFRRDRLRSYQVIIDGERLGKIGSGENREFPISPGRHRLRLKVDWAVSKTIEFDVNETGRVSFACQPNGNSFTILWDLFLTIGNIKPYIKLWQISIDSPA